MSRHFENGRLRRGLAASAKPPDGAVGALRRNPDANYAFAPAGFRSNEIYASESKALSDAVPEPNDHTARSRAAGRRGLSRIGILGCLTAALAVASMYGAAAQDRAAKMKSAAATPLPPARPAKIGGDPVIAGVPPSPATTPAVPQALPPVQAPTSPQADAPASPQGKDPASQPNSDNVPLVLGATGPLPTASRQRMHACGLEWQAIKMAGRATDKTWRDFAEACLSR